MKGNGEEKPKGEPFNITGDFVNADLPYYEEDSDDEDNKEESQKADSSKDSASSKVEKNARQEVTEQTEGESTNNDAGKEKVAANPSKNLPSPSVRKEENGKDKTQRTDLPKDKAPSNAEKSVDQEAAKENENLISEGEQDKGELVEKRRKFYENFEEKNKDPVVGVAQGKAPTKKHAKETSSEPEASSYLGRFKRWAVDKAVKVKEKATEVGETIFGDDADVESDVEFQDGVVNSKETPDNNKEAEVVVPTKAEIPPPAKKPEVVPGENTDSVPKIDAPVQQEVAEEKGQKAGSNDAAEEQPIGVKLFDVDGNVKVSIVDNSVSAVQETSEKTGQSVGVVGKGEKKPSPAVEQGKPVVKKVVQDNAAGETAAGPVPNTSKTESPKPPVVDVAEGEKQTTSPSQKAPVIKSESVSKKDGKTNIVGEQPRMEIEEHIADLEAERPVPASPEGEGGLVNTLVGGVKRGFKKIFATDEVPKQGKKIVKTHGDEDRGVNSVGMGMKKTEEEGGVTAALSAKKPFGPLNVDELKIQYDSKYNDEHPGWCASNSFKKVSDLEYKVTGKVGHKNKKAPQNVELTRYADKLGAAPGEIRVAATGYKGKLASLDPKELLENLANLLYEECLQRGGSGQKFEIDLGDKPLGGFYKDITDLTVVAIFLGKFHKVTYNGRLGFLPEGWKQSGSGKEPNGAQEPLGKVEKLQEKQNEEQEGPKGLENQENPNEIAKSPGLEAFLGGPALFDPVANGKKPKTEEPKNNVEVIGAPPAV